jgi:hypothetical protein
LLLLVNLILHHHLNLNSCFLLKKLLKYKKE